ncbi:HAMP domain-containing histidine kinase [Agromyces intestinalis]|uniref:Sensor histidine kinase MtrB n=1 Tax=Agromyces intestinalis TaxID=2592652 RepID=A0A5C1YEQ4_9MICO|nr:MtrAB system histidine kinase MtrB [Agromyces intestinalis]QEO13499.1 HAMP domain-containing histidine kinase [Agromyces intestinalis]
MTGSAPAVRAVGGWRGAPRRIAGLWRRSLQFRTVLLTIGLSSLAILVIGLYITFTVASNLFQNQLDRVLTSSNAATYAAQTILGSTDASDRVSLQGVMEQAMRSVQAASGSSAIGLFRDTDEDPSIVAPQDRLSPQLAGVITPELREMVQQNPDTQFWQSVALPRVPAALETGTDPGVVVGSDLQVPGAGRYLLYIGYNFADAEATLAFMQATGLIGAIALILLLSAIILLVVRWVIEPVRTVAATSRRLAAGDLGVRMPAKGEDELATLSASFNGMADSLQARIRELAELSVMQQRFVSDVSHELRTPLTTIRLAGDVLHGQREEFDSTTARTVELLHTQTERFEALLGDLLEISRYDAGSVELATEPTNLVHLAGDAVESLHELAREHGSELRLVAPGGHLDAEVDPRRIRRIVRNLVGNAIEHGEGRPIVVAVDSNESAVGLSVRDYGMGMTEEERMRVFDRFWRADPSRSRTIGGTGLGLAISLEDAAAHGGTLDVWSKPGRGTVFRLVVPRTRGRAAIEPPLPLEPDDPDATGPNPAPPDVVRPGDTGAFGVEAAPTSWRPADHRAADHRAAEPGHEEVRDA